MTVDRRVRRTRRNLGDALIELILERGYERITVQDILDRADVGRSTFYAHYTDKQALLLSCFDGLREDLDRELAAHPPGGGPPDVGRPSLALFEHAHRNRRVYRALCGRRGGTVVHTHLHALVAAALTAHLAPRLEAAGSPVPAEAVAEFATAALLGLLFWWVGEGFPRPPAELAGIYGRLASPGIEAALAP